MVHPRKKQLLLSLLVVSFAVQTFLVYADDPSGTTLEGEALEGARVWHRHNCQACHQLFGLGGFLGPDLTNATARIDLARVRQVMEQGSGQMPAFGGGDEEASAIYAFLEAMNESGQGEARRPLPPAPPKQARFEAALESHMPEGTQARAGLVAMRARACMACHMPLEIGIANAPDLSTVAGRLAPAEIEKLMREGRPGTAMPPPTPPLSDEERAAVMAFLSTLAAQRESIARALAAAAPPPPGPFKFAELPWWEYRPTEAER